MREQVHGYVYPPSRSRSAAALHGHRGAGLVVAHDRAFLDALVTRTLWVEGGLVGSYEGT